MHQRHQSGPPWGPVPEETMRATVDIPLALFDRLERASRRRRLDFEDLVLVALNFAAAAA